MKPEQFIREFGPNTFRISMSFVNTAKYLVVHEGEIDFTDEIKLTMAIVYLSVMWLSVWWSRLS
ncbi:hypothetical protein BANRA_00002 [Acinetobacter baumannii]|nr:hypothetical protein BANRA_00002 [Acinetobacter baumannii]